MSKRVFCKYEIHGDYVVAYTTNSNRPFLIDLDDIEILHKTSWRDNKGGYITGAVGGVEYKLHRIITSCPKGMVVDHINHDTYDNRKSNLRVCTCSQNQWNARHRIDNATGYRGVAHRKRGPWMAYIDVNKKRFTKEFKTKEEAIAQRRAWEEEFFGEYTYKY